MQKCSYMAAFFEASGVRENLRQSEAYRSYHITANLENLKVFIAIIRYNTYILIL